MLRSDADHDEIFIFKITSSQDLNNKFCEDFYIFEHNVPIGMPQDVYVSFFVFLFRIVLKLSRFKKKETASN